MTSFEFNTTRSIINEPGSIKRLGEICTRLGFERPLVVTDPGIVKAGLLEKLTASASSPVIPLPPKRPLQRAIRLLLRLALLVLRQRQNVQNV